MWIASYFFLLALCSCHAAPADGPTKVGLLLNSIPSGIVTLGNAAMQQTAAIGELAGNVGTTFNAGYTAIGDKLNNGFGLTKDTLTMGLAAAGGVVNNQYKAAGNLVTQQLSTVTNLASKGTELAQNVATGLTSKVGEIVSTNADALGGFVNQVKSSVPAVGIFEERPRKIESAVLETEGFDSRTKSIKENVGSFFNGIFQPRPIVDTITEDEKYGNDGDRFASIGRVLVTGSESLASFVSNAISAPFDIFKQITRSASAKLNNIGSKLVGL